MTRPLPPAERLRELYDYDPETGDLIMRPRPGRDRGTVAFNRRYSGRPVTATSNGYLYVHLDGRQQFHAHRVIWKIMTGEDPPSEIDHRNRVRTDNRWTNLRAADRTTNMANITVRADNKLRLKGAYRDHTGRYRAQIKIGERRIHLGRFDTPEAAHEAYCKAALEHFGDFSAT